jgi:hypothetical protein
MDGMQIFRLGKMCDAQLVLPWRPAAGSRRKRCANRPTLARVEITTHIFGAFLTANELALDPWRVRSFRKGAVAH